MKTYYHNTTAQNDNNIILGHLSIDGDFVDASDNHDEQFICQIICEGGLLSAGETYQDYCKRVAKLARKSIGMQEVY